MTDPITPTRMQVWRNIYEGRDPYDGFTGSSLGGAVRSIGQVNWDGFVSWDAQHKRFELTDAALLMLGWPRKDTPDD